jgi:hypothetical protein
VPPDKKAARPLIKWCRRKKACFYPLTEFLAVHGGREAGKVLLEILKADLIRGDSVHIAEALTKLKPAGAVPVLERRVHAHHRWAQSKKWRRSTRGLGDLGKFGQEGSQALLRIFRDIDDMPHKLQAARLMADGRYEPAARHVEKLLRRTVKAGQANEKLVIGDYETREGAYVRTCISLLESLNGLHRTRARKMAEEVLIHGPSVLRPGTLKVFCAERDLSGFFRVVPVTPEIARACNAALKRMKLVGKTDGQQPCNSIEAAQRLLWGNINIAATARRSCTEHGGWYFFSRLDWAKPDDGTFGSGFAVKKGTTEIHRWE